MKNVTSKAVLALALLSFTFTGCLKDKGFENYQYGINDPDTQPPGVGFPFAAKAMNGYGLDVSGSPQTVAELTFLNLNAGNPAPADITINLAIKSTELIGAYNTANGTNIQVLPTSLYTMPTTVTIPAGARNVTVPLVVTNTLTLNPNIAYGIAVQITSASGNYIVAENLKNLLIQFSIKNKYDGVYNLTGYHNRVPYTFPYQTTMHMVTSGPNAVYFFWPLVGGVGHPIGIGANNAISWYGPIVAPVVVFNTSTNLVTNVFNGDPGGAPPITMFTGAGSRLSKWDPATRNITVDWNYNNNPLRAFFDNLQYLRGR
ncbi:MAG: DUF1735 domain-containing protein [Bacteroidota bacterium]